MIKKLTISNLIITLCLIIFPLISSAQPYPGGTPQYPAPQLPAKIPVLENLNKDIDESAKNLGYKTIPNETTITEKVAEIINGVVVRGILSLLGILFLVLLIINGYKWMVAGGNEEIITKAKRGLQNALIGLGIVLFAYLITYGLFSYLKNLTIK